MTRLPLFVALSTFAEYGDAPQKVLEASGHPVIANQLGRRLVPEEIVDFGRECVGIVAGVEPYDARVLNQLPHLRCISRCGVGLDNIDLKAAQARHIIIRNTPDVVIQPVAELTVAMIFDLLKRLSLHSRRLHDGQWKKYSGNLLAGKTVGIVGLGRIGKRVAQMLTRWGVAVIGSDVSPDVAWAQSQGVTLMTTKALLETADIVTLHLSVAAGHSFHLNAEAIGTMKPGAFIVNVSRGSLIDDHALADALHRGHLAGAALDVYPNEPYQGPLCGLDNVVLTPHIATLTAESRLEMELQAAHNLIDALQGA